MKTAEDYWIKVEQRIHLAEERHRKAECKEKNRVKRRCLCIGERMIASFPRLAEAPEETALDELEVMIKKFEKDN